jgi:DNA replication protein DnaC
MEIKQLFDIDNEIRVVNFDNEHTAKPERFYLPFDPEKLYQLLGARYKAEVLKRVSADKYVSLNEEMKQNIMDVAKWLCDPNKRPGLLLYGNVGTGKTTLLHALAKIINTCCEKERDSNNKYKATLEEWNVVTVIKAKTVINESVDPKGRYNIMLSTAIMAIDELGVEPTESKLYGNVSEPLIDLLCERYDRQLCTIISTNMGASEIADRYGRRVSDRFNEMFATVPFTDKSFRQ